MMSLVSQILLPFRKLAKLTQYAWGRWLLIILGLVAILSAVWFGFPMTGVAFLSTVFIRIATIVGLFAVIGIIYLIRWRIRRKKAQTLEDDFVQRSVGDGAVLAERMQEALAKLKSSGGKNYLYDLPWYVIIGPPGAGKTTALTNAGIEFPGLDAMPDQGQGFGGTRNCDWWFAEDAVLIDTAGRYTTQDSDAAADQASWTSFLDLLKKGRADQPINGVILAFSVEDMMNTSQDMLARHAKTVRSRLGEIHETLKIDFPVYVLFTKADLISGFREYFGSFSQSRRRHVWGVTFQTKDRKAETYQDVASEFDALVSRLSDEVIDRMSEEPDGVARISIFGLPGQMAMLRDNVQEFMRRVFEPTRYKTNAILRGFYFTSGTQEGTPIDQVLGAMSRDGDGAAFQPAFMSGKGKSFFLYDLMTKVVFEESDWVSFDQRAIRRRLALRTAALVLIGLVTFGSMGAFAWSFWQNKTLLAQAESDSNAYFRRANSEISRTVIDDTNPSIVMPLLQDLRLVTAGYGDPTEATRWEGFGLSKRREVNLAATKAYSDGLERMLRPRMLLHMENEIPQLIADEKTAEIYRALKVYLLLGGQGEGRGDDGAITAYFDDVWTTQFGGVGLSDERDQINAHLAAMLELDDDLPTEPGKTAAGLEIDASIVSRARDAIVNLPLADQAYASIKDRVVTSGFEDFNLANPDYGPMGLVFEAVDGAALDTLRVPALFTFEGYWGFFLEELTAARERLREDSWVLGDAANRVGYETQLAGLERELHRLYRLEFNESWKALFARISVARMSLDPPNYDALGTAASPTASPLLTFVREVEQETNLARLYSDIEQLSPEDLASAGQSTGGALGQAVWYKIYQGSGVLQRVVLDSVTSRTKSQTRVGNALAEDTQRRQVERISEDFQDWHALLKGPEKQRPIDLILSNLGNLRENRRQAARAPTPADETLLGQALAALTANNTALPEPVARMLNEVDSEFSAVAREATLAQLNRALNDEVTQFCRQFIEPFFPFGSGRHVSPAVFGQFFGPGGRMDSYYTNYLQPHVLRGSAGLEAAPDSPIGQSLSPSALRQFDRAQAIQLAFFATGSPEPEVPMSVTHTSSSQSIEFAVLSINGAQVRTQPESAPAGVSWPGQSSGVSVEVFPGIPGRNSSRGFTQGRWDIVNFLRQGRTRVSGNVVDVTHEVGGRTITYRIEFDSTTVPFLMSELSDFSCPASLE